LLISIAQRQQSPKYIVLMRDSHDNSAVFQQLFLTHNEIQKGLIFENITHNEKNLSLAVLF